MKIGIASDHAGYLLKEFLKNEFGFIDFGCKNMDRCDYPDYAKKLCKALIDGKIKMGILICGTGIGMSIFANRIRGIRAALCINEYMAEMSRKHNNSNILCLPGRILKKEEAKKIVNVWIRTRFINGIYEKRIKKIELFTSNL